MRLRVAPLVIGRINCFDFHFRGRSGMCSVNSFFQPKRVAVNRITQPRSTKFRPPTTRRGKPNEMLDILLSFDQALMEFSMRMYKISRRERLLMRKQNRRLHAAVREHLPRLLKARLSHP